MNFIIRQITQLVLYRNNDSDMKQHLFILANWLKWNMNFIIRNIQLSQYSSKIEIKWFWYKTKFYSSSNWKLLKWIIFLSYQTLFSILKLYSDEWLMFLMIFIFCFKEFPKMNKIVYQNHLISILELYCDNLIFLIMKFIFYFNQLAKMSKMSFHIKIIVYFKTIFWQMSKIHILFQEYPIVWNEKNVVSYQNHYFYFKTVFW